MNVLSRRDRFQSLLDGAAGAGARVAAPVRSFFDRAFVEAVSSPVLSRGMAHLADLRVPAPLLRKAIDAYVRAYDVDLADVDLPLDAFATFDEFFTRALRPGARPVDPSPDVVVSPADARLSEIGAIPASGLLDQVKGRRYSIGGLLGDEGDAGAFRSGAYATLYLSPRDYHRVHFPVDGRVTGWRHVPGRLYPVNDRAVRSVDGLFAKNERLAVRVETERFGPVAVVMVGAANVSRMTLSFPSEGGPFRGREARLVTPPAPIEVRRGDELGRFHLGSTVVLLLSDPRLAPAGVFRGEHVRMGAPLLRPEPQ